jgi:hypothetical protein
MSLWANLDREVSDKEKAARDLSRAALRDLFV